LIDNPGRYVAPGLNRAVDEARGEVITRMDGHCEYPSDYVTRLVKLLRESGASNVGGVLEPAGDSYVSRAVSVAYYSPVGIGGAQKGHSQ
ncbi:MAG: glycosyltransferase, partial [Pirellulales bacterium]|nr:glycosyltransferase [Pirellulales bacterium]